MADYILDRFGIDVTFTLGPNPCLSIKNSYRVKKAKFIRYILEYIHGSVYYEIMRENGYTRTLKSEYREWKAHNFLYRLGICRKRTSSCDIDQNESKWKRFAYAILSIF